MERTTEKIDNERAQRKISKVKMAGVMGISEDTYHRRLQSEDGFTAKEIERAAAKFDWIIMFLPKSFIDDASK